MGGNVGSRSEQRQLFGWSNPAGPEKAYEPKVVDEAWDTIVNRVHKLRLKFLSGEESVANADRFVVFPEELRALREPVKHYLDAILTQSRYDEPFLFRGFYISSGVQQGKPIAQATRDLLKGPAGSAGAPKRRRLEAVIPIEICVQTEQRDTVRSARAVEQAANKDLSAGLFDEGEYGGHG